MTWELLKRNDVLQGSEEAKISFRTEHIGFNAFFCRAASIHDGMRVQFYIESSVYKVGFRFHEDRSEQNSYLLSSEPSGGGYHCAGINLYNSHGWINAIVKLPANQRRFVPIEERTPEGKIWVVTLCPCFDICRARESTDILATEAGIYRYVRDNEVVYIGRGNVKDRLSAPHRADWDFDIVEYSVIEDPDEQVKWESHWINKFKQENGKLPLFNRISGARLAESLGI